MTSLFDFSDGAFLATFWAIIPSIALASLVYFRGHNTWREKIFVFSSLVFVLWAAANYISLQPGFDAFFWARLVLFFAVLLQFVFLLLVYSFSGHLARVSRVLLWGLAGLSALTMASTLTSLVFTGVTVEEGGVVPSTGPLMPLFALTVLLLFGLGGTHLIHEIKKGTGMRKSQLAYIGVGYFVMFVSLIVTQFIFAALFRNTALLPFGPLLTIPFLLLVAYSIFRHNLFNIRVIITEIFTAVVILIFTVNVFFSSSILSFIINSTLLIFVIIFGILLIRGTYKEIRALQELSDAKSEFISIASHQLRTPLSAIKGYISMIIEGTYGAIEPAQKEALNKVYASNERLVRLVNDLLNVSRIDQGRLTYNFAAVSIAEMTESIVSELQISASLKGLAIHWQKPAESEKFIAWADEGKLRQAVINLIDNAIKYTESGHIEVILRADINPAHMRLEVRDTGIGMSPTDREKIFKRFSRGKESAKINASGSGLGLFVAKQMVEGHRGRIWAESGGVGRGSTFIITLPFYRV